MSDIPQSRLRRVTSGVGRSLPSALRTVSIGSVFEDLSDDWDKLDEGGKRKARRVINAGAGAMSLAACVLAAITVLDIGGTNVVHVFARTEHVRYTPLKNDPPQWLVENATIRSSALNLDKLSLEDLLSSGEPRKNTVVENFSGFFQPHCGDTIIVSRVGKGSLRVSVSSAYEALVTDMEDRSVPALDGIGRAFTIALPGHHRGEDEEPSSTIWPLEGRIDPGRAVGPQTNSAHGLLLEGKVEVVAGRMMDFNYPADQHDLELGDQVLLPTARRLDALVERIENEQMKPAANGGGTQDPADDLKVPAPCKTFDDSQGPDSTDKGFIHLDERKGMNVSLSSNSRHAEIVRYRTAPIRVENNWIKRLVNDPVLSIGWTLLGVFFLVYRRIARWTVSSLARARQR